MGIRYSACPVAPADLELARAAPLAYMNDHCPDAPWDDPSWTRSWLDLDKSWRDLQRLFVMPNQSPAEMGLDLVRGDVRYPRGVIHGYECHYEVLDPNQVEVVARHIARYDKADVLALYIASGRLDDRLRGDVNYVGHYLAAAQEFTARQAEAGNGLVYRIG
ncbi:DUF1877 family protein [Frigoribacterium sp. VKM Ac-1396]|uniref:DUF1877 family protein n=1 Tax=Frigoribacterium sp. VKM Ac-1396 TaxID=2783821 RepID=UPI00188D77CE|nr:DUF1877 family protein [Frigoribacterium sp. VKM Ac-1396]MBF4601233.1 DUF1877 family protein [Frigoribacterium sp. VKM Ac-1396]